MNKFLTIAQGQNGDWTPIMAQDSMQDALDEAGNIPARYTAVMAFKMDEQFLFDLAEMFGYRCVSDAGAEG